MRFPNQRAHKSRIALWILASFACLAWSESSLASDDLLLTRFVEEAPRGWANYRKLCRVLILETTERSVFGDSVPDVFRKIPATTYKVTQRPGNFVEITSAPRIPPGLDPTDVGAVAAAINKITMRHRLNGFNPAYAFDLHRSAESLPWTVSQIIPAHSNDAEYKQRIGTDHAMFVLLVGGKGLDDFLKSPDVKLLDAEEKNGGVQITFECGPGDSMRAIRKGVIVFDPSYFWLPLEYTLQMVSRNDENNSWTDSGMFTYSNPDQNGLKQTINVTKDARSAQTSSRNYKFTWDIQMSIPNPPPPESEFTLSGYGIAEPDWARRQQPWFLIFAAIGIVIIVGALAWRRFQTA